MRWICNSFNIFVILKLLSRGQEVSLSKGKISKYIRLAQHPPMRPDAKDARKRWYSIREGEADIKMLGLARLSMAVHFSEYMLY